MDKKSTTTKKPTEFVDVSVKTVDQSTANLRSLTELLKSKKPASAYILAHSKMCEAIRHAIVKLTEQKATCFDENATHSVNTMKDITEAHDKAFIKLEIVDVEDDDEGCTMLFDAAFGLPEKEAAELAHKIHEAEFKSAYIGKQEGMLNMVSVFQLKCREGDHAKFINWTGPNHLLNFIG